MTSRAGGLYDLDSEGYRFLTAERLRANAFAIPVYKSAFSRGFGFSDFSPGANLWQFRHCWTEGVSS
jgi:hypothetical protein